VIVRVKIRKERVNELERRVLVMWIGNRAFSWRLPRVQSLFGGLAALGQRERK
jgi:hypothetical protein